MINSFWAKEWEKIKINPKKSIFGQNMMKNAFFTTIFAKIE